MILVTLAYMDGWTDVRTYVHDVMAIKSRFQPRFQPSSQGPLSSFLEEGRERNEVANFLASMGYHIFLTMVLRARLRREFFFRALLV